MNAFCIKYLGIVQYQPCITFWELWKMVNLYHTVAYDFQVWVVLMMFYVILHILL